MVDREKGWVSQSKSGDDERRIGERSIESPRIGIASSTDRKHVTYRTGVPIRTGGKDMTTVIVESEYSCYQTPTISN